MAAASTEAAAEEGTAASALPPIPAPWPCALVRDTATATPDAGAAANDPGSGSRGRFVVTTEAVAAGVAVLEDEPYAAVVADAHRGYVCARCLHLCTTRVLQCGGCHQAHYCSEECVRLDAAAVHAHGECQALVGLAKLGVEGESQPMRLALRIALRNHGKTQASASASSSFPSPPFHTPAFVRSLDHHMDKAPLPVRQGILAVAQALAGLLRPAGVAASASELAKYLLAIQCNAHAIRNADGHVLGLGLFPLASMLNHSCRPTAHHAFRLQPGAPPVLVFRTLQPLAAGRELCYSYSDLLQPGPLRQAKLRAAYYFQCACGRCAAWAQQAEAGPGAEAGAARGADHLIERALASPACTAGPDGACPGVLLPAATEGAGKKREEVEDEDDDDDRPLRCSVCGAEEAAAAGRTRLAVGTALLEARLRALAQGDEGGDGDEEDAEWQSQMPGAVKALADLLLGSATTEGDGGETEEEELPSLSLHSQHWLVTQGLLALCPRLAQLVDGEDPGSASASRLMWLSAAAEAWALQSLWLIATTMTGRPVENDDVGGDEAEVGRFPELGRQLLSASAALRRLGGSTSGGGGEGGDDDDDEAAARALLGIGEQPDRRAGGLLAMAQRGLMGGVGTFAHRLRGLRALVAAEGLGGLEALGRRILGEGAGAS